LLPVRLDVMRQILIISRNTHSNSG